MGGRIWIESEPGVGSRFHFIAHFGAKPDARSTLTGADTLQGLRVLVVDDNATNRRILEEMLANWRMEPVAVAGASAALETLCQAVRDGRPFPVVITDAMMPEVDGFTLAEQIRKEPDLAEVKLLILTSAGLPLPDRASEGHFAAQLTKPVKQSDLLNAILNAVVSIAPGAEPAYAGGAFPAGRAPDAPLRVLVAEDNPTNQKLLAALLEHRGYHLTMVGDGSLAVAKAREEAFDLILMDVQMPEMSGLEAASAIRREEAAIKGPRTPMIALTAHAMAGDRERCLAAGMDAYLAKPLRPDELLAMIDRFVPPAEGSPAIPTGSVDGTTLLASFGDNRTLLAEVIDVFLEDAPRLMADIDRSVAAKDPAGLAAAAHTLKGTVGLFSGIGAYEIATKLTHAARRGELPGNGLKEQLDHDVRFLVKQLEELRRSL
jgi:CheY-like chemotaxis protein/HPt (histidine-containing phosphotransfer) domain-containing protein